MKTILLSGASSGMGYFAALALAKVDEDLRILAIARREDRLQQLLEAFDKAASGNKELYTASVDLSRLDERTFLEAVDSVFGIRNGQSLDIMINNAGYLVNKSFADTTLDDWKKTLDVNLLSTVQMVQWLFPYFNRKQRSHIVNIGSMGGVQGTKKFAGITAYSVSKGAVNTLTELLAEEFQKDNIAVNCINPGAVQTDMLAAAFPGFKAPVDAETFGQYIANFALTAQKVMNGQLVDVSFSR